MAMPTLALLFMNVYEPRSICLVDRKVTNPIQGFEWGPE